MSRIEQSPLLSTNYLSLFVALFVTLIFGIVGFRLAPVGVSRVREISFLFSSIAVRDVSRVHAKHPLGEVIVRAQRLPASL